MHPALCSTPLLLLPWLSACRAPLAPDRGGPDALVGPLDETFRVPGWRDRDYLLHLPPGYDGTTELPLVLAFHGGGGKKEGFDRSTCPEGDVDSDGCMFALADALGFIVVAPDGVDAQGVRGRSWNAGGGEEGWRCVGGVACEGGSDDVAYVDALLDELHRALWVDEARVYATGISNGGGMSHRLACERAEVFAAIAPIAGANQALGWPGCEPARAVPVLHIHGTEDPCWKYGGGPGEGLCSNEEGGDFMDVETSMEAWFQANGCSGTTETALSDAADDGTTVTRVEGQGCAADTVLLRVEGGGHTWPRGWQYLKEARIGRVSQELSGAEAALTFFSEHTLP